MARQQVRTRPPLRLESPAAKRVNVASVRFLPRPGIPPTDCVSNRSKVIARIPYFDKYEVWTAI